MKIKKKMMIGLLVVAALFITFGFITSWKRGQSDLETVSYVDLERYQGLWYDVASFPQRFQSGCHNTTARYTLHKKGYVIVENQCNKGGIEGKLSSISGKATVVKNTGNAKLKVQFFWPFKADYWIIMLDEDYRYAVVSHPTKKYLWILSRTPQMDEEVMDSICATLQEKGFDLSNLQKVVHKTE